MNDDQKRAAARRAIKWELLSGLFGWVWIISGIAFFVFLILALFLDGSWWNALYALVISSVGKWLLRGFEDHKRRVFFEAELMANGMTAKEAGDAWVRKYLGSNK